MAPEAGSAEGAGVNYPTDKQDSFGHSILRFVFVRREKPVQAIYVEVQQEHARRRGHHVGPKVTAASAYEGELYNRRLKAIASYAEACKKLAKPSAHPFIQEKIKEMFTAVLDDPMAEVSPATKQKFHRALNGLLAFSSPEFIEGRIRIVLSKSDQEIDALLPYHDSFKDIETPYYELCVKSAEELDRNSDLKNRIIDLQNQIIKYQREIRENGSTLTRRRQQHWESAVGEFRSCAKLLKQEFSEFDSVMESISYEPSTESSAKSLQHAEVGLWTPDSKGKPHHRVGHRIMSCERLSLSQVETPVPPITSIVEENVQSQDRMILEGRVNKLENLYNQLAESQAKIRQRYEGIEEALGKYKGDLADVTKSLESLGEEVNGQKKSVSEISQVAHERGEQEISLIREVAQLIQHVEQIERQLADIEVQSGPMPGIGGLFDTVCHQFLEKILQKIFVNDEQIAHAAQAFVDQLNAQEVVPLNVASDIQRLQERLVGIIGELAQIRDLTEAATGQIEALTKVHGKFTQLLNECRDYARGYRDRQLELAVPITLSPSHLDSFFEGLARAVRTATVKVFDPLRYFGDKIDRLITEDLVTVIDICDSSDSHHQLQGHIQQLLLQSGLEDVSPHEGQPFDARGQSLLGFREGGRDLILSVNLRGFKYHERSIRKAGVVVGR